MEKFMNEFYVVRLSSLRMSLIRNGRRIFSVVLTTALVLLSPGLGCYEALAGLVQSQAATTGALPRTVVPIRAGLSTTLDLSRPDSIGANLSAA